MPPRNRFDARQTYYRGTLMRSRLEASAAAILDEMRTEWQYEPACFADGSEQYLPDFQLWASSQKPYFLEVKPESAWKGWPTPAGCDLDLALTRMLLIRATYPEAVLSLWMPDTHCSCGGRIIVDWPGDPDYDSWAVFSARPWLELNSAHYRGEHVHADPGE